MTIPFTAARFPGVLKELLAGAELDSDVASAMIDGLIDGELGEIEAAALLVACEAKGVTARELAAFATTLLLRTDEVTVPGTTYDIVGTGGDGFHTVNISTMAALVVAGSGRVVVKHGNRAASSMCGTADVLEALGVNLYLSSADVERVVAEAGVGFCFAGHFHKSMGAVARVRRTLGVRTLFNYLGPLTNPSQPTNVAAGVAAPEMGPVVAQALASRGARALVVRGDEGMDEMSVSGPSSLWMTIDGRITELKISPGDLGLPVRPIEDLTGGSREENAAVVRRVLQCAQDGPVREAVLANAAIAMATDDLAESDMIAAIGRRMDEAARVLDSGAAWEKMESLVEASHLKPR